MQAVTMWDSLVETPMPIDVWVYAHPMLLCNLIFYSYLPHGWIDLPLLGDANSQENCIVRYVYILTNTNSKNTMIGLLSENKNTHGAVRSTGELQCSNVYGGWFTSWACHSVRMTYRPSAALWLLRSLRISHNKFLWANKWILPSPHNISNKF